MLFPRRYSTYYFPTTYSPNYSRTYPAHPQPLSLLLLHLHGPLPSPRHVPAILARALRLGAHDDALVAARLIGRLPPRLAARALAVLPGTSLLPFNAAIRVLSESPNLSHRALALFKSLKLRSLSPNDFTFSFLLKAASASKDASFVRQVHAHVAKSGVGSNGFVANGLLSSYVKGAGDLLSARKVFDEMPQRKSGCCWTCLVSGYAQFGLVEDALRLFARMVEENLRPEDDTMVGVISACSKLDTGEIEQWVNMFTEFGDQICDFSGDAVDTVLIYLHAKLDRIDESRDLFDKMVGRRSGNLSVIAWNAMIGGYVQNSRPVDALGLFHHMLDISITKPNHVTIVSVLSACALVGDLNLGRWAHAYAKSRYSKLLAESNKILATAFIDMYSKCGSLEEAEDVFDQMATKDVVSFNAMIMGLATNGRGNEALKLFFEMDKHGVKPNDGTFLGLLCACTHSRLVEEGRKFFKEMHEKYNVVPRLEHYACFVDLIARAGFIEEALQVVNTMPIEPNGLVWGALLGASLVHSKVDIARDVAERLFDVDPESSAGYVLLSNAYATNSSWGNITELRCLMRARGVSKQTGFSWINIEGIAHEFHVGSVYHPEMGSMYSLLNSLTQEMRLVSC
ncbi:Pentatricopeptide repeat-containing protein, chloroplastic [Ananas comosus]|uniref:Pentatricopeptide repeat-containing protein, chloroplastic n=1 Tax=Ananas comosus TaxID=4615 RepID=A0A199UHY2_ANACO|nr:Pentatricopeptide repeat-containing protein, chloroplastic [Ananas comosus]